MTYKATKPTYDITKSWEHNYSKGPFFKGPYPPLPKDTKWEFLGYKLISPLGIAAGPLPNAKWLSTYAKLGYGSLIQKTVRSVNHPSHKAPNIVYVDIKKGLDLNINKPITGFKTYKGETKKLSITNSFGNPSKDPKVWTKETKKARKMLSKNQILGVSVYGTEHEKTTLGELAKDYAKTARLAKAAGAMFIEANLACPNVKGSENPFLYKDKNSVVAVSAEIKKSIGNIPLILKIGYFDSKENLLDVLSSAKKYFDSISAINTIPKKVVDKNSRQILPNRDISGICGYGIKEYGIKMVKTLKEAKKKIKKNFEIIGVGGVMEPQDVQEYLKAGANHVQSATAVMWNPYLAHELDQYLSQNFKWQ